MTQRQLEVVHLTGQPVGIGAVCTGKTSGFTSYKPERTRLFWD
ncbi:MAG: hypothetical protein WBC22_10240 [Sedimentisphaerales bacterium]